MRKRSGFCFVLTRGLLLIAMILSTGQQVAAQDDDFDFYYYFPLFDHHTDPYYAFGLSAQLEPIRFQ